MSTKNPNHDPDPDNGADNGPDKRPDNGRAVAPAPTGGALASLQALGAALAKVDTSSIAGRSGLPMLQFKREGSGTWMFGQKKTVIEDSSRWAINPLTFKWGYICFGDNNKVIGEHLVSVSQPMPDVTKLPDKGFAWQQQWTVNMKCLDGTDAGVEVVYKPTTDGGIKAVAGSIETVRERLNSGQHDGKVAPIVHLEKYSYPHSQFGLIWAPLLTTVDWMPLDGPAPAPASKSPPPPAEQPRRRRLG